MTNNETIVSVTTCMFANRGGEIFLVLGTAQDLVFEPKREAKTGWLHVYALLEQGTKFHLVHKTEIGGIPGSMASYDGKLLVGVNSMLRLYDFGKKKLLRKCEHRVWESIFMNDTF
jgi:splicing factor 3B subunit 3